MLGPFAKKASVGKPDPEGVDRLYAASSELARAPVFFTRFSVPDTTDGRYDLWCLTLSLFLFRLQQADGDLAQAVFNRAFKDIELGLREAGVGDLSVSKHMKKMLEAFYGRAALYYEALEQQDTGSLTAAMTRNVYNGDINAPAGSLAEWVRIAWMYLSQIEMKEFIDEPQQLMQILPPEKEAA
jgi:cytochrome b pre-mRNA-processing protein 3